MDLKKCFNNIRWICGYNFLKEIGVPTEILRLWIHSIANICQYWVIQGEYLWSVVVMVALASAWVCYFVNTIPARSQPCLSAYAGHLVTLLIWHLPLKDTGKAWIPLFLIAKSAKVSKFVPHSSMVLG